MKDSLGRTTVYQAQASSGYHRSRNSLHGGGEDILHSTPAGDGRVAVPTSSPGVPVTPPRTAARTAPMMVTPCSPMASPASATISTETMRQMESRRRARREDRPSSSTRTTTATTAVSSLPPSVVSVSSPPPSTVLDSAVQFKVKSVTTGAVFRFQCLPTFNDIKRNITERLNRGRTATSNTSKSTSSNINGKTAPSTTSTALSTHNFWTSASNIMMGTTSTTDAVDSLITSASYMFASTLDANLGDTADVIEVIEFQDLEGDWCTLTNDSDLQDALDASERLGDDIVRFRIKEPDTSTRVWQSISTQFGW